MRGDRGLGAVLAAFHAKRSVSTSTERSDERAVDALLESQQDRNRKGLGQEAVLQRVREDRKGRSRARDRVQIQQHDALPRPIVALRLDRPGQFVAFARLVQPRLSTRFAVGGGRAPQPIQILVDVADTFRQGPAIARQEHGASAPSDRPASVRSQNSLRRDDTTGFVPVKPADDDQKRSRTSSIDSTELARKLGSLRTGHSPRSQRSSNSAARKMKSASVTIPTSLPS